MLRVLFGIDQVLATPGLLQGRIGLVTNTAARMALDPGLKEWTAAPGWRERVRCALPYA